MLLEPEMLRAHDMTSDRPLALVVDDEHHILRAVSNALAEECRRVVKAATGADALDLAAAHRPDVIILDLGLPDLPGQSVCAEIRKWSTVPILVLSARHSEREKVALLDVGADDYITKPFSPDELRARVRVQLRRAQVGANMGGRHPILIDGLTIDLGARVLRRDGREIHLTPTEWDLLRTFVRNAGKTLTHQHLFNAVWARSSGDPRQYLRVYIATLRRKIENDVVRPGLIVTEPGVGYRFAAID